MPIGILYSTGLKEYDFGQGHPFRGERYELFYNFLRERLPEDDNYRIIEAPCATDEDLHLICNRNYIEFTRGYFESSIYGLHFPGRFSDFHSMDNMPTGKPGNIEEAARLVVGQAKLACQLIHDGSYQKVVSIGGGLHHAKSGYGEGFCIYNDIAFAAKYLQQEYGLTKIMILDTDAHAGNGTAEYFYEDASVLYIDIHQDPGTMYPHTGWPQEIGSEGGRGFTINIPVPTRAGRDSYNLAFETIIEPVTREFEPQIIIRNGGSDPHFTDGLAALGLSIQDFKWMGEKIRGLTQVCGGKLIDMVASGYYTNVLPYAWLAMIAGIAGIDLEIEEPVPVPEHLASDPVQDETQKSIDEVLSYIKYYWRSLR
jgi:acetoin utilization protein AcuC